MPKPKGLQRPNYNGGSGGSRFSSLGDYQNDHDNREEVMRKKERNSTRRVSFKFSQLQSKGNIKNRLAELAIRTHLEDDEDMDGLATTSTFDDRTRGPRRKGSPIPKFGQTRKLMPSTFGWYQVTVQFGQRYSKDDVIRALLAAISPEIFIPHYWRIEKSCVQFFVDDYSIAQRLQSVERSIQMNDGYRISIRVRASCPVVTVDEEFKEKMKQVMAKRYNAHAKALDMSKFHADPDFRNMFCGLFRSQVMSAALDIMEKNIPDLEALNLNENSLSALDSFKNLDQRLPHLKILYLGDNNIASLANLLVLRNVPIMELVLKSNPLRQRYKDQSYYVSEVRRKFPKLVKLDGEELEPQILFDVNDTSLPRAKASFLCDVSGADLIRQFLEQYFIIFDSDNRQPLLDAYHEQALMSISVPSASQAGRLQSFWKFNRNFRRIVNNDEINKIRQLKVGRLSVVATLAEWPKTQHDPQSFTVDLTLFTPKLISFTVAGLFKEFDSTNNPSGDVRYFQRQFVIVPAGGGFCIRNEMIFVTSAIGLQTRAFLKPQQQSMPATDTAATATVTSGIQNSAQNRLQMNQQATTSAAGALIHLPINQPDDATKMQMIQAMSMRSHMNMEWSKKCLEENNWDYNHATLVFDKLQKENKVPPEAFAK
uniref:NTF2 domain-containing protein n=1 Tax=Glossina brevipalpis TaxID=37001 RepID=A0A1A9X5U0_9MUSC